MKRYLLSVYQPDGAPPPSVDLERIGRELAAINEEMRAEGAWVFAGGLTAADSATVVRACTDDLLITDGPFVEGKEHLGGLTILSAPDLDAALRWAGRIAGATDLPIEVRAFADH
ncbi:MAG: YciI family protein [Solirubrobacterales bacterium]